MQNFCAALLVVVFVLGNAEAGAQYSIKEFIDGHEYGSQDLKNMMETDLVQMGNAFNAANAELMLRGGSMLYCAPTGKSLVGANYMSAIKQYVKIYPLFLGKRISNPSTLLLAAMKKAYPCN